MTARGDCRYSPTRGSSDIACERRTTLVMQEGVSENIHYSDDNGRRRGVLAIPLAIGIPSMSAAATFVYVSDAEDATIDAYVVDAKTGALTSIGKIEAGKTVMPMAVAPNKKIPLCRGPLTADARAHLRHRP